MLLNKIGMKDKIPECMRCPWGGVTSLVSSAKQAVADIGVRGGIIKQQIKQFVTSFMVVFDENNNIMNKYIGIQPHMIYVKLTKIQQLIIITIRLIIKQIQ